MVPNACSKNDCSSGSDNRKREQVGTLQPATHDREVLGQRVDKHDDHAAGGTVTGRGMAFVKYELNRTYVGMVATVEIVPRTGVIKAKHLRGLP